MLEQRKLSNIQEKGYSGLQEPVKLMYNQRTFKCKLQDGKSVIQIGEGTHRPKDWSVVQTWPLKRDPAISYGITRILRAQERPDQ